MIADRKAKFSVALEDAPRVPKFIFGYKVIHFIELRPPKAGDVIDLDWSSPKASNKSMLVLASRLSGIAKQDLMNFSVPDINRVFSRIYEYIKPQSQKDLQTRKENEQASEVH